MGNRSILTGALALGLLMAAVPDGHADQTVPEGYVRVAMAHGVPPEALYSVSLSESSRKLPRGIRPWPWTINVAGKGYRYETRLQAWQALQVFMKRHPLKRIDVGIAQVNLGWNGHHFASTWDAFDPYTNLNAAATILRECWARKPGSW
ncbi:lytic transglycosylase domain-containing protein, partial [Salmonella enterica subsp. enterica serovar Havana]|nr:lytic transglycosylase domain-containing protein [Salmonella enterica subsp. enterica serovar Havana]EDV6711086.1 lytic transglycosylase domain-containing protein [Salmonella enterica subsp. enterica serovar Havana]